MEDNYSEVLYKHPEVAIMNATEKKKIYCHVVTRNGKVQNERIKKASPFYHLVKGLIRNNDINEKCTLNIF